MKERKGFHDLPMHDAGRPRAAQAVASINLIYSHTL